MVKLIALTSFSPDGSKRYKPGDTFEVSDKSANILIQTKKARLAIKASIETRDMKAADESEKESASKKGRYDRRDMRARP